MKFKIFKIAVFFILFFSFSSVVFAQQGNFPEGSSQGTMEMNRNTRPVQIPNIDINITQPQSGSEVAFSVRLLIVLTILTLAPSLLLLLTCFLRFSIVLDFIKRALSLE